MKDYKRLTERDEFGNADIIGLSTEKLYSELCFSETHLLTKALNKLADLEDKIESGEIDYVADSKTEQTITDLLIEFDEMGFAPTTVCPNLEQYATEWRERVRKEFARLTAENAALQKRLDSAIELPCKVGDTVYSVFEFPNEKTVLKGTCKHININICSGFPEIFIKLVFETNEQLFLRTYSGNDLNNIFLLRSAAEARLEELKGGKQ